VYDALSYCVFGPTHNVFHKHLDNYYTSCGNKAAVKTQRGERGVREKREEKHSALVYDWEIVRNVAAGFRELFKFIVAQERLYTFPVCCLMCVCQGNKASLQQLQQLNRALISP
jgi:hypothetical protein